MSQSSGSQTQQTQQQGTTAPWQPAQPLLQNILGNIGGVNTGVTNAQNAALGQLVGQSSNLPNYAPQVGGVASQYLNWNSPQNSFLNNNVNQLIGQSAPYESSNYLNPQTNPATAQLLNTLNQQIGNNINGQFAAAGRDMSPANTQALAMGLSQGEAPTLFNQYNQNVGAQQNATNQWLQTLLGGNQANLQNYGFGAGLAGQVPGLATAGPMSMLQGANLAYGTPLSNIGGAESLTLPIAGLGSQYQGTGQSNTQTTLQPSLLSSINQGLLGAGMLFG